MTFLKRNWLSLLLAVVCVVLTVTVVKQNRQLAEQSEQIQKIWGQLRQDVSDIYHLKGDVEELKAPLAGSLRVTVEDVDPVRRQVTLNLTLTPAEDATLRYPRVIAHRPESAPLMDALWPTADLSENGGVWEGKLTLPVEGDGAVMLSLVTDPYSDAPGVEILTEHDSIKALLPVTLAGYSGEAIYNQAGDGKMYFGHCETTFVDPAGDPVTVKEPRYQVYRNGVLALDVSAQGYEIEGTGVAADPGDQMELKVTCQDSWGISYEFALRRWEIGPDWRVRLIEQWRPTAYPAVIWPRSV